MPSSGFLLIDKPAGWTSFDVVAKLRGITGVKTIGHAGTLDPFATGLLLVAVGRDATKTIDLFMKQEKTYEAIFTLGATSNTDDGDGTIVLNTVDEARIPAKEKMEDLLSTFIGTIQQVPPAFSAIKRGGVRLYAAAREGKPITVEPRPVFIRQLTLLAYTWPELSLRIECGSGFYVRALARDMGVALGVGGYCSYLRRTRVGSFSVEQSVQITQLTREGWERHLLPISPHPLS